MDFSFKNKLIVGGLALLTLAIGVAFILFQNKEEPEVIAPVEEAPVVPEVVEKTSHQVIGTSVEGRPIDAYTYGTGDTNLLFVGGIHGGYEWNSVLLAYGMMDHLAENPDIIPSNLSITIVPSANPDGLYEVIGKEGRFEAVDVPAVAEVGAGRFNANEVDLNRNFDCKWQSESMWRGNTVSAGNEAFSEPEAQAIRSIVTTLNPKAVVFWHSQSNAVYASECEGGILPETRTVMDVYSTAAGYPAVDTFDAYAITGDAEGWLASVGIPAVTVELATHESIEWAKNLAGVEALLNHFGSENLAR